MFKSAKIFTVLQVRYEITYIGISLIKLGVLCIVLLHWFACLWGLAAGFEAGTNNWILGGGMRLADLGDLYAGAFEYSLQAMVCRQCCLCFFFFLMFQCFNVSMFWSICPECFFRVFYFCLLDTRTNRSTAMVILYHTVPANVR